MTDSSNISSIDLFLQKYVIVGSEGGDILILDPENLEIIKKFKIEEKVRTCFMF